MDNETEVVETNDIVPEDIPAEIENPEEIPEDTPVEIEEGKGGEKEEEIKAFNPDELDFSDNDTTFGIYDLSDFKDYINFDNAEGLEAFRQEAKEMEKRGFTQDQVKYVLEKVLELEGETGKPEVLTQKEVQANLKKYLTIEEQRNYRVTGNYVKEAIKGTEVEIGYNEIMSNPMLLKFANALIKKAAGGKMINKSNVKQGQNINYTVENAQAQYDKYLTNNPDSNREDKVNFLTGLYKKMPESEKSKFESIFDGLFNK